MTARAEARARPAAAERVKSGRAGARLRAWREQHLYSLVSSLGRLAARPFATLLPVGVMAIAIAQPLGLGLALGNIERFSGSVRAVVLRTPEEGLEEFRAMSDLAGALDVLEDNPLPTVLVVQPAGDGAALAEALARMPEVDVVQHDAVWRQRLSAWLAFGERVVQVVALMLGLGVLLVVGNTVRLDIAARSEEIGVLQHLGATDAFVRRPFLYLGAWYGFAAGLLAGALLLGAGALLQGRLSALVASYGTRFALDGPGWHASLGLLAGAAAMGWLGAWLATGHHLRRTRPTDV